MKNSTPSETSASQELPLPENLQPPMANGEVIFDAPWQGRIFAMAVALSEQGVFAWAEFQQSLIDAIGLFDAKADASVEAEQYQYFDHFQLALENLLAQKGVVLNAALNEREQAFADRPHGHDHDHDPRPTTHDPRPTTHDPRPTTHDPRPLTYSTTTYELPPPERPHSNTHIGALTQSQSKKKPAVLKEQRASYFSPPYFK